MGKRSQHANGRVAMEKAQETPDEVAREFDMMSINFRTDYFNWRMDFEKKMRLKHGDSATINSSHTEVFGAPSKRLVMLEYISEETS